MPPKKTAAQKKEEKNARQAAKGAKKAAKAGKALFHANDDIDKILADLAVIEKKTTSVTITPCGTPSPRTNASLVANPLKPELILYGGEHYNGRKVVTFNELYFYVIPKAEFRRVQIPNPPPARTSHQAVCIANGGVAQMWVFGGDFTSPAQLFRHYNDLWVLDLSKMAWEQVKTTGGPPSRSGHRMVYYKRKLYVFGGFHDSHSDIRYFDDLYSFDLDTMKWTKIAPKDNRAHWPSPRSGFGFVVHEGAGVAVLYGGFCSQLKKKGDFEETSKVLTDMWVLNLSTLTWTPLTNKAASGQAPRSGCGLVSVRSKILAFGGVTDFDSNSDEDQGTSVFYNDLRAFHLRTRNWEAIDANAGRDPTKRDVDGAGELSADAKAAAEKERVEREETERKVALEKANAWKWNSTTKAKDSEKEKEKEKEREAERKAMEEEEAASALLASAVADEAEDDDEAEDEDNTASRSHAKAGVSYVWPRRNAMMCSKGSLVYLFGGCFERGDVEVTLNDLHFWDSRKGKGDTWHTLIDTDLSTHEWFGGEDEEDDDDDDDSDDDSDDGKRDDDDDDEEEEEEDGEDANVPQEGEPLAQFFTRTKDYWTDYAKKMAGPAGTDEKLVRKNAYTLATKAYNDATQQKPE